MHKKGAIVQHTFIFLLLAIIGFAIVASVFFVFFTSDFVDRTACRKSVEFRGSIPDLAGFIDSKGSFPLQCKTKKYCVTDNLLAKGSCEGIGFRHNTIRVKKDNGPQQNVQIVRFLADEMIECWHTMGEGDFQIFSNEISLSTINNACVICSRVGVEEEIQENLPNILGLTEFMITNNAPNRLESYSEVLPMDVAGSEASSLAGLSYNKLRTSNEKSIVYMEGDVSALVELGGLASLVSPSGPAVGAVTLAFPDYFSSLILIDTEDIDDLNCDSFENLA